jgi:hypothetical protein
MSDQQHEEDLAAKDKRIDDLVLQAEKLVGDLNSTVTDMKRILRLASQQVEEARSEQRRDGTERPRRGGGQG